MSHKIEKQVENIVKPHAERLGFELVDVEYRKREGQPMVTVFIHKEGGVDLDDCAAMHHAVLDDIEMSVLEEDMTLNISSPGLDRNFKYQRDYERNIGKEVEIRFYVPYSGMKKMEATLLEYNENNIKVQFEGREHLIRLDKIAKIHLAIKF